MKKTGLVKLKMLVIGSILTLNGILAQQNSADTLELWTTYLRKKSQPIKLTPGTDDDDLKGLKKVLSNKRIVLLGEFNHGSKEINLLKNQNFTREIQRTELTPTHFATRDSIIQDYQRILTTLEIKRVNEKQLEPDLKIIQKALENRIAYLHYFTNYKKQLRQRWAARDSMMAANIIWYATELYPQEKIIISAHNYHISKFNEKELVMGELLKAQFPEELYTIGFFGGQGTFANNSRKPENLSPGLEHKDIKTLIASLKSEAVFFDFPHKNSKNTTWLEEQLLVNDTFIDLDNHNKMHLGKCFDGLFLIKNITPAVY